MTLDAFTKLRDKQLLQMYSDLMEELRSRELVRSGNNPVGDYAEKVIAGRLRLTRVRGSNRGFDAKDGQRNRYQIKARRITLHNASRQLGVIRNLQAKEFDYLLAGIFDKSFTLKELWQIPHAIIGDYAKPSKHQNGYILHLRGPLLHARGVRSLLGHAPRGASREQRMVR